MRRISPARAGFLLLMLIAFTSIILGLATTFYVYCQRGVEDSQVSVRLVQQRLALSAALAYVVGRSALYIAPPVTSVISASGTPQSLFVLQDNSIARTKSLGWFRVAAADSVYVTNNYMAAPYNVSAGDVANCVFITAGAGPLAGQQVKSNDLAVWEDTNLWRNELRSWYLVELDTLPPVAPATTKIKRVLKLPVPPQSGTGGATVFYW